MEKRADERKYHYIYRTTCVVSSRWYVGMHSTENLDDGYIGSGKRLWHSINKHGRENHVCEILEFWPDRKSLAAREKELVNAETLKEEFCMNLKEGGDGGFPLSASILGGLNGPTKNREHQQKAGKAGGAVAGKMSKGFLTRPKDEQQLMQQLATACNYCCCCFERS